MVLSNKKLKQKLRSLLAESLATTESKTSSVGAAGGGGGGGGDVSQQLQSLRELRSSKSQNPNSSKRPKRKKKPTLPKDSAPGEGAEGTQNENSKNVDSSALNEKDKSKKRKRVGDGDQESAEKKPKNKKKKPTKNKEKKKENKKENKKEKKSNDEQKDEKNEKGNEGMRDDADSNAKGAVAPDEGNEGVNDENKVKGAAGPIKTDESGHDPKKVYVGGIPYYSTEDDITSFFEKCGTITEIDCMRFPETGKFRGIAILTFKTEAAAKRALALDGEDMGGFYLKIQPYKAARTQKTDFAPEIVDGYNRIYAGNLSWDITEDDLRKLFSECKISTIRFGEDKETGEFKGYAHVDFSDSASLATALKLDQEIVCGRPVRIRCAVSKKGAETTSSLKTSGKKAEDDLSTRRPKRKKGPCYQCGITGHLASACPQKTAEVGATETREGSSTKPAVKKAEEDTGVEQSKKKRRTCYECGIPGHLSSDCPKKNAEVGATEETETYSSSKPAVKKVEEDTGVGHPKKKRRTCYECGIPGHLSSECPKKKTAAAGATEETEAYSSSKPAVTVEEGISGGKSKKKRRTCYECGVPGHLSSDCPTKKAAEGGSVDIK